MEVKLLIVNKKNRIAWIDIAKGIALLAVMLGHIGLPRVVNVALYTFHLPLFFLLSGYLFSYKGSWKRFLAGKARAYLVPYVVLAAGIVLYVLATRGIGTALVYALYLVVQRRCETLWFLTTLFLGVIIFRAICGVCKNRKRYILPVALLTGTVFILYDEMTRFGLPWNLDTAMIIQIFLAIGYCSKGYIDVLLDRKKKDKMILMIILLFGSALFTVLNLLCCGESLEMYWCQYGIFPLTILGACFASLAIILFSSLLKDGKVLRYFGENTMIYFGWHQMPVLAFVSILVPKNICIQFILMVSICFLVDKSVDKTRLRGLLKANK